MNPRTKVLVAVLMMLFAASLFASSMEVSGTISSNTIWTGVDTVKVVGDIYVNNSITLTIDPGIYVEFQGHYKLDVQGTLLAIGTSSNMITFTAANHSTGWNSIVFDWTSAANDSTKIVYCKLEYGKATTGDFYDKCGGALWIDHFHKLLVSNCMISNNYAAEHGGAIRIYNCNANFINNNIDNNEANHKGGAIVFSNAHPMFINNTICNNTAATGGGIALYTESYPTFKNTIIFNNSAGPGDQVSIHTNNSDPNFYFCDIEGGTAAFYLGLGVTFDGDYDNCIDADPQFVGSGNHPFDLSNSSPCINAGDPTTTIADVGEYDLAGNLRFIEEIIDIGAYEAYHPDNFAGYTLEFDGDNDFVEIPDNPDLDLITNFTIEAWIKADSWKANIWEGNIVSKEGSGYSGYMLRCGENGKVNFCIGTGTWNELTTDESDTLSLNTWYHIAAIYDGVTQKIYIDGYLAKERSTSGNLYTNTNSLMIGTSPQYQNRTFNGKIEEVRIWDIVRSEQEIRENMYLPLEGRESGLVSYWQLNEGSGTIAYDYIKGNDGTLNNMDTSSCWHGSNIPFGDGESDSQTETTGTVNFTGTDLSMYFYSQNGAEITVTKIDSSPNLIPTEPETVFDEQYWIVNRYGTGTFNADLTFTISENLTSSDESNPVRIKLFTRESNAYGEWTYLTSAVSVNAADNEATFEGITGFSQFIIGIIQPKVALLKCPLNFILETENFNSIDDGEYSAPTFTDIDGDGLLDLIIGEGYGQLTHYEQESEYSTTFLYRSYTLSGIIAGRATPAFTDLDGNGLLDLIIGEYEGNLNHYEQDIENSTSFSLVTENFNSIDVGMYSVPTFIDIDNNGLLDLIIGDDQGELTHYEQNMENSTSFTIVSSNFNSIDVGGNSTPAFIDLDEDGLLDLIIGEVSGNMNHYEQDSENSSSFTLVTGNFNSINVGSHSNPTFTDIDGNGLADLIIGEHIGNLNHYEQESIQSLDFGKFLVGNISSPGNYFIKATELLADLNVECPEGFKVSLSENSGFLQNISFSPINGIVSDTLYVRFEPDSVKVYSGNITHTTEGAETKYIAVSGTGIETDNFPGTALEFDGTDDYVETSLNDLSGSEITIEYWFKGSNTESAVRQQSGSNYIVAGWHDLHILSNDGGTTNGLPIGSGAEDGNWHHIAMSWKQNTTNGFVSYLDGEIVGQRNSIDASIPNINANIIFGSHNGTVDFTTGSLEEIRIWNVARDSVQIRENMYLRLTGAETGLIGYWQFNEGSDNTAYDFVGGNHGTLTNMDTLNCWIDSTIPFGDGISNSQTEIAGTVDFTGTDLSMDFNSQNGAEITVSRIDTLANLNPTVPDEVFDAQYWVVNRFGSGTFDVDLTFTVNEDLTVEDQSNPESIGLMGRESNSDGVWSFVSCADSIDAANDKATFTGITGFSQFIIGRGLNPDIYVEVDTLDFGKLFIGESVSDSIIIFNNGIDTLFVDISNNNPIFTLDNPSCEILSNDSCYIVITFSSIEVGIITDTLFITSSDPDEPLIQITLIGEGVPPDIVLLTYPLSFINVSNNFNSIDVGGNSTPVFTDLDGDDLLDLIIGEIIGKLIHYEQDAINSSSFSLVSENFNSIDVAGRSTPTFTDLDGDGLLDLIIGEWYGNLHHYEQDAINSISFSPVTNNFNSIDVGYYSAPTFTDIDGDDLLDLIIGEYSGKLYHYEQDAINSSSFSLVSENFNSINVAGRSNPTFTDLDGDDLLDLIIGDFDGNLNHYEQDAINSIAFSLITENFNSIVVGTKSSPTFTDLDGDGLSDLIIGETDGNLNHYEQEGIEAFNYGNCLVGNSYLKAYYIKVNDLINDLNIECLGEGFKISLFENSGFMQNISINPVNGRVSDTLYVRFEPDSVKVYSGNIIHTSNGAETKYISVSGTGVESTDNFPGNALEFDGTDDYVETNLNNLSGSEITIEYWFKGSSTQSAVRQQSGGYYIVAGWNDLHILSNDGGTGNGLPVGDGAEDGNWHHIAMTWKQNTTDGFVSYLDGNIVGQRTSIDASIPDINANVFFGSKYGTDEFMAGSLEEIHIWNVVRDSIQIRDNMHLTLSGFETGLTAYWQLNEGNGTTTNAYWGIAGTLKNMDENNWIESTIPIGGGISNSQTETSGTVDFTGTDLSMYFNSVGVAEITVTRIDTLANINPTEPETVFDAQYWVVNRFGTGTFDADLTFTLSEDLTAEDEANPSQIKLYTRPSNADTNWVFLTDASSINSATDEATFDGITEFSQFIIGRYTGSLDIPQNVTIEIIGTEVQLSWDEVTGANSYKIYASDDPYAVDWGSAVASVSVTSWSYNISGIEKKFYRVVASTDVVRGSVKPVSPSSRWEKKSKNHRDGGDTNQTSEASSKETLHPVRSP